MMINWKGCGRKQSKSNLRQNPGICLEEQGTTTENLALGRWFLGLDMKLGCHETKQVCYHQTRHSISLVHYYIYTPTANSLHKISLLWNNISLLLIIKTAISKIYIMWQACASVLSQNSVQVTWKKKKGDWIIIIKNVIAFSRHLIHRLIK
jgi:hypothetical protein